MTAPIVTFFDNKGGGVGKTSLVYHLAWMLAELGHRVIAADLDPQANLTSAFLDEDEIAPLWEAAEHQTVWGAIKPFAEREPGGLRPAPVLPVGGDDRIGFLPGDMALSSFEDQLSEAWPKCLGGEAASFRTMSVFWELITGAAGQHDADVVLVDVGPSLGAINRAALVASSHVIIPVAPDLFSLQGLRNLGPALHAWRSGWAKRLAERPASLDRLPGGDMRVTGYVVLGHGVRLSRPVMAYGRWMQLIPDEFRKSILKIDEAAPAVDDDPHCLAQLKHYRSLMPLAQEARKPMFALKPADGAFGGHFQAAQRAHQDFRQLASTILTHLRTSAG